MVFESTDIAGLWVVGVVRHGDARGSFGRTFCAQEFAERGLATEFVQANSSVTDWAGTMRAMHFQTPPHAEAKLVRCVRGAIYDVVADVRPGSSSFMRWLAFRLEEHGDLSLYIPPGCAHGFQTLSDDVEVVYQMSTEHAPSFAAGFRYDDPAFGIVWPREVTVIAEKDLAWPAFASAGRHAAQL